jgi:CRISPR-associated protein Cmr1
MPKLTLTLETVTPLLMNGAEQTPEIRAASFRGVLRYWLRAVLGGVYQGDIAELKEAESHYFGSTEAGSPLRVRIRHNLEADEGRERYVLPPTVRNRHGGAIPHQHRGFHSAGEDEPERIWLTIDTHPLQRVTSVFTPLFYSGLLLAFHLGAFGKRARRGGGVLQVVDANASLEDEVFQQFKRYALFQSATSTELQAFFNGELIPFVNNAQSLVGYTAAMPYIGGSLPKYPVWMRDHVKVLVKGMGFQDDPNVPPLQPTIGHWGRFHEGYRRALQDLWDISGSLHLHHTNGAWGYAGGNGRRASAVHLRVHKNNQVPPAYYPVVTMFRSGGSGGGWNQLEGFDQELQKHNYVRLSFCTGVWI